MNDEFDVDDLHRLVDRALHGGDSQAETSDAVPSRGAFTFGDSRLFERLADILPRFLTDGDVQTVLTDLRNASFEGLQLGSLRDVHTIVKHCRRCPQVNPDPQLPEGNLARPDVVFLDATPGVNEKLREFIAQVGFAANRIAFTSAVRCVPIPGPDEGPSRPPTPVEVSTCASSYLFAELQLLQPKLIVTLGTVAYQTLLGDATPLGQARGSIFWLGPWAILPTNAIGFTLHRKDAEPVMITDLQKAYAFCYGDAS